MPQGIGYPTPRELRETRWQGSGTMAGADAARRSREQALQAQGLTPDEVEFALSQLGDDVVGMAPQAEPSTTFAPAATGFAADPPPGTAPAPQPEADTPTLAPATDPGMVNEPPVVDPGLAAVAPAVDTDMAVQPPAGAQPTQLPQPVQQGTYGDPAARREVQALRNAGLTDQDIRDMDEAGLSESPIGTLTQALDAEEQAIVAQAQAQSRSADRIANQIEVAQQVDARLAQQSQEDQQAIQDQIQQHTERLNDLRQEYDQIEITDPWADKDTGAKIAAAIAIALGGIGAGMTGGPNVALQTIESAIERDLRVQAANKKGKAESIRQQRGLLQDAQARLGSMREAQALTRDQMWKRAQSEIDKLRAEAQGEQALANLDALRAQIDQKRAEAQFRMEQAAKEAAYQDWQRQKERELAERLSRGDLTPLEEARMMMRSPDARTSGAGASLYATLRGQDIQQEESAAERKLAERKLDLNEWATRKGIALDEAKLEQMAKYQDGQLALDQERVELSREEQESLDEWRALQAAQGREELDITRKQLNSIDTYRRGQLALAQRETDVSERQVDASIRQADRRLAQSDEELAALQDYRRAQLALNRDAQKLDREQLDALVEHRRAERAQADRRLDLMGQEVAAKAGYEPQTDVGKILADYRSGAYGDPASEDAQAIMAGLIETEMGPGSLNELLARTLTDIQRQGFVTEQQLALMQAGMFAGQSAESGVLAGIDDFEGVRKAIEAGNIPLRRSVLAGVPESAAPQRSQQTAQPEPQQQQQAPARETPETGAAASPRRGATEPDIQYGEYNRPGPLDWFSSIMNRRRASAQFDQSGGDVPAGVTEQSDSDGEPKGGGEQAPQSDLPRVRNPADYNALPSGAEYIDPQGNRRRKP